MVNYYDEVEIEDFAWDPLAKVFHYPCPCGDRFEISKAQLRDGDEVATCPSCSLIVRIIYDYLDWEDYVSEDEEDAAELEAEDSDAQSGSPISSRSASPQPAPEPKEQHDDAVRPTTSARPLAVSPLPTVPPASAAVDDITDGVSQVRLVDDQTSSTQSHI